MDAQRASIIGESAAIRKVVDAIDSVAPADDPVLISGESGTGKKLVARAVHAASSRRFHPFVVVHCASFNEDAIRASGEGGTVFLDEVGDLGLRAQSVLLRLLETLDVRPIAATAVNLRQLVESGHFRSDLFERLSAFPIELPPLRERREDIPLLTEHFIRRYAVATNKTIHGVSPEAMRLIEQYAWPGNVRELKNAIEHAVIVSRSPDLRVSHFTRPVIPPAAQGPEPRTLDDAEKLHILRILEDCNYNQTRTAEVLKIDRVTLHNKLKRYGWTRSLIEVR